MKVKLTVNDIEKFKLACESQDIALTESKNYGSTTVCIVNIKHASQLYNVGLIQNTIVIIPEQAKEKASDIPAQKIEDGKAKK